MKNRAAWVVSTFDAKAARITGPYAVIEAGDAEAAYQRFSELARNRRRKPVDKSIILVMAAAAVPVLSA